MGIDGACTRVVGWSWLVQDTCIVPHLEPIPAKQIAPLVSDLMHIDYDAIKLAVTKLPCNHEETDEIPVDELI